MTCNKIVLGTVQFGLNYGVNNQGGKVSEESVRDILNVASQNGISILDTSSAYGNSEEVLGRVLENSNQCFKIVSKYPRSESSVEESFEKSLQSLGQKRLYGYLMHHFECYQERPAIWDEMRALRESNRVEKVGFSIYTPEQLELLFANDVDFDIIQFPYNIFDRQFEPYFKRLKENNVEIHVRSVFLQGLFFKNLQTLPTKLEPLRGDLITIQNYCLSNDIKIEELALNFVSQNESIDGVLIGVDNTVQLNCNIATAQQELTPSNIDFIRSIDIKQKELLNPVNWK